MSRHGYIDWRTLRNQQGYQDRLGSLLDFKVLGWLFTYAKPYKKLLYLGLISLLLYTGSVVAIPAIILLGINQIIETKSLSGLNWVVGLFFANAVVNYITQYANQVLLARVSQSVLYDIRSDLFDHLEGLSMAFYDKEELGRIMSRIQNDVRQIEEFVDQMAVPLGDLLTLAGIVGAMIYVDWKLALICMSFIPFLTLIALQWQRYTWPRFMRVRRAQAIVNGNLQENISGMRLIQSLNREEENLGLFSSLNKAHLEASLHSNRLSSALNPTVEIFKGIGLSCVIIFGGMMVSNGGLTAGVVVAFALWMQRFFEPIRHLTQQYTQVQRTMTAGAHIMELKEVDPIIVDAPDAKKLKELNGIIDFKDVHFWYEPDVEVLKGINLRIQPGETIAVVGATGAGKTTLSNLLLRLYDVTDGAISVNGHDIRDLERASMVSQIGTVIQEPFLFSGTIADNIRFSHAEISEERIIEAAKVVGAHQFISQLEKGYKSQVGERGSNLSVGQRQLIALARALVFDPKVIILDEATASVDSYSEMKIQESLNKVLKGRTAIVIAHRLSTVRNADRIIVMDQGQVVEEGNHKELIAMNGIYSKLYRMNFGVGTLEGAENNPDKPLISDNE